MAESSVAAITSRLFEPADWSELVRFYETFYRPGYIYSNRRFFDWAFNSPFAKGSGQRLLLDLNRIVGIMGCLPWPLQVQGERVLGQCNINLLVDPAYRGQRLG